MKYFIEQSQGLDPWSEREVGWFKVNIDTEDEIKMSDEPNQLIMTKDGLSRLLHFNKIEESLGIKNHQAFAEVVKELSGDWINEIECKKIQSPQRFNYDEVVYFGP